MIVILKQGTEEKEINELSNWLEQLGNVKVSAVYGSHTTILGLVGDTSAIDASTVESRECVEAVKRVQEPVSYTHLDVYKRQIQRMANASSVWLCAEKTLFILA